MKVLVFTALYPNNIWPNQGVFVKERMTEFAKQEGCSARVIAPVPYFPPLRINERWSFSQVRREEIIDGVQVFHPRYLMIPKVGMAIHGLMMFLSVLPAVRRIRREFDFDLIDGHYVYPDGFAAVYLGRILKKPVVLSARGSDISLFPGFPVIRNLVRHTLFKADKVIAVSQALKREMKQLGVAEEKIVIIPNGVDARKFYPVPKESARRKLGLPHGKMILSVGNLTPNKGFVLLLKALKILVENFKEKRLYLIIVGEGVLRNDLERMVSSLGLGEHVRLVGTISHRELLLWYSAADVFCLASKREGWPNVLLESMACGTPVVATSKWGVPEIVKSDKVGFLTERSATEIAETLWKALRKPWRSDDIVHFARQHTWDGAARSVRQVFESVLDQSAS